MKKALSKIYVLTLFMLVVLILTSCGKREEEIVIWAWNQNVFIMEAALNRYIEEVDSSFKARVEPFSQGDIDVKIKTASQLNNPEVLADIILGDAMRMRGYYDLWADLFFDFNNALINETDRDRFVPSTIDIVTVDDVLFAMPYGIAPTLVFAYRPLWKNEDIEYIIENGWTWDDYKSYGLQIKDDYPDQNIYMTAYNMRLDDRLYRTMTSQHGEWFMDQNHEVQVGNTNSVQAMTWVKDFFDSDIVGHVDTGDYRSMMLNGQIAAQIQGFFLGGQIKSIGQETSGDWILLPLPSWEIQQSSASITGGSYLYVNNFRNRKDASAEFVKWYTLNTEAVVEGLDIGGIFPALLDAYDTDYFEFADPFYGGQVFLKDISQNVSEAPPIFASKYNSFNYDAYISAQEAILFSQADIVVALTDARNTILNNATK